LDPLEGDYVSYFARLSHPFIGRSNNPATLLVIFIIPLAMWGLRMHRRTALVVSVIAFSAIVLTMSRGVALALGVSGLAYLFLDRSSAMKLLRWLPVFLAVGTAGLALFLVVNDTARTQIGSRATADEVRSRVALVEENAHGTDDQAAPRKASTSHNANGSTEGWLGDTGERLLGDGAGNGQAVHNTVLQQFFQFGPVGGLLISLLLLRSVLWWQRRRSGSQWLRVACGAGVMAQMGSTLAESSYEGTLLRSLMWFTWGLMLAWVAEENAERPDPSLGQGLRSTYSSS
jgi:O-antigen ligase